MLGAGSYLGGGGAWLQSKCTPIAHTRLHETHIHARTHRSAHKDTRRHARAVPGAGGRAIQGLRVCVRAPHAVGLARRCECARERKREAGGWTGRGLDTRPGLAGAPPAAHARRAADTPCGRAPGPSAAQRRTGARRRRQARRRRRRADRGGRAGSGAGLGYGPRPPHARRAARAPRRACRGAAAERRRRQSMGYGGRERRGRAGSWRLSPAPCPCRADACCTEMLS